MDLHRLNDPWFTVESIDEATFAISEYGHWEQVHSFLLIGGDRAAYTPFQGEPAGLLRDGDLLCRPGAFTGPDCTNRRRP